MTLVEFLLERIAEDETIAERSTEPFMEGDRTGMSALRTLHPMVWRHVIQWTPARVFAECETKRYVIGAYQRMAADPDLAMQIGADALLTFALKPWVLRHAGHPDFRKEWVDQEATTA